MKRETPEARLQKAVCQALKLSSTRGLLYFSIPNEGKRSAVMGGHLKQMGMRSGAADLAMVHDGRVFFLELKTAGEKQRDTQLAFEADALLAGARYACCDNINSALEQLRAWGLVNRLRVAA